MILAGTMLSISALTIGIASADDEEGPLKKIMEKVNAKNLMITKGTRTAVAFKKAQKDVVTSAEELVKLAKEAKPIKDAVKKAKDVPDAGAKWDKLMDELVKTSEELAAVAAKPSPTNVPAKDAHKAVKKVCTECHAVFRIEEE
jgi:anthranilate phosphoribosyltransferase